MRVFENQTLDSDDCKWHLGPKEWHNSIQWTQNESIDDISLIDCKIVGARIATFGKPLHRSTMRNIHIKDCSVNGFSGHGAVFDEVVIDGLKTSVSPVILHGCAFRRVVVKGIVGRFLINRNICHDHPDRNAAFVAANDLFYESVDWAIDISEAKASCFEIRGSIPSRLVRRNQETQVIMTRNDALAGHWRNYNPPSAFQFGVSIFLDSGAEDTVFVAAPRAKHFKEEREFFQRLKSAGLVN